MIDVLRDEAQIIESRKKLRKLGCDSSIGFKRLLFCTRYLLRFRRKAQNVAINKSWDVLKIVEFFENNLSKDKSVYDMGSFNCEAPLALWDKGYRKIFAADLNPLGRCINWYGNKIEFRCEDFYHPTLPAESLDAITSLSVLEHGFNQKQFFETCNYLLKKGGYVCLSTDFSYNKIEIDPNFRIFNLSYIIFSKGDILNLIEYGKSVGFHIVDEKITWPDSSYPIEFLGHKFTFIFLVFKKI
jgi:SAM-dependent methyltransferase